MIEWHIMLINIMSFFLLVVGKYVLKLVNEFAVNIWFDIYLKPTQWEYP